jgi:hypothetical protein
MAERDPIDLMKEQLQGIEGLTGLHANHEKFKRWHEDTRLILEKAFGSKSIHCQSFTALRFQEMGKTPFASHEIDRLNASRFKRDLEIARNILQGVIKELTLDRTLFKKLQTTPKSVEVTLKGEYFLSASIENQGLAQAVRMAFEGSGLTADVAQKGEPIQDRINRVKQALFGIYGVSDKGSGEGMLELGVALTLGKKTLLLCHRETSLPDFLKGMDFLEYEFQEDISGLLKKALKL